MAPREQRAYMACVNCRRRKHNDQSAPPWTEGGEKCRRCQRTGRECVVAPSRYSKRKTRASEPTLETNDSPLGSPQDTSYFQEDARSTGSFSASPTTRDPDGSSLPSDIRMDEQSYPPAAEDADEESDSRFIGSNADQTVADSQLQNPGDALDLLIRVAHGSVPVESQITESTGERTPKAPEPPQDRPVLLKDLDISLQTIRFLLSEYHTKYHPFFPIANDNVLNGSQIETSAAQEPHLLLVLLTIASKQDLEYAEVHRKCSEVLQNRLSRVIYHPPTGVEAVEALLLLAEWIPQRFQSQRNVGTGEEDRAAWMQVGLAIRLAYLQELDSSSFSVCSKQESQVSKRHRVAWAACFMSDRQISIRVGKAFWSRGPGPASVTTFDDYNPFKLRPPRFDDYSSIFQANLELTKLFSNAHDVLYASGSHRDQLFKSGEYAKYIDDFRLALLNWHDRWGSLSCSAGVKVSLIISYEYLRLYITSFAYEATLSRINPQEGQRRAVASRTPYLATHLAGSTDARFIYEAVNAAKTLLSTFNSFVDPAECSRYMPIKYYLYVIFSAVFLYKTKATGVLNSNTKNGIENLISKTIQMLKQTSAHPEDIGNRHSNLLAFLWNKTIRRHPRRSEAQLRDRAQNNPPARGMATTSQNTSEGDPRIVAEVHPEYNQPYSAPSSVTELPSNMAQATVDPNMCMPANDMFPIDLFSWRDLEAVGQFAMAANSSDSSASDLIAPSVTDELWSHGKDVSMNNTGLEQWTTPDADMWTRNLF